MIDENNSYVCGIAYLLCHQDGCVDFVALVTFQKIKTNFPLSAGNLFETTKCNLFLFKFSYRLSILSVINRSHILFILIYRHIFICNRK